MRIGSTMRGLCALAFGLLSGVAQAQHATGSYNQVVNKSTTGSVVLASSANPSGYTQSVTFTATVPTNETGSLTFFDGTTQIGLPVTIAANTGSTTISTLSVGNHSVTAQWSGDANYAASTSNTVAQVVGKGASGLSLASSPNPSNFGASVAFTASLNSAATGNVSFFDGTSTTPLGTSPANSGVAILNYSTLTAGSHNITAQYAGDTNFNGVTSNIVVQVVNKASTTTPTLVADKNPATFGATVTFTATLPTNATGTITFFDGTTSLGTPVTLTNGVATFPISTLGAGSHSITASYSGDSNYAASISAALAETINKQTGETITLASSNLTVAAGNPVTFTATVPTGATGTVTFSDNGTAIGTPQTVTSGTASYTTAALTVGSHSITATYNGDTNYSTVTSAALTQTITKGVATVTINGAPNPSNYGQSVVMTITVTGVNGVIPTGTVTLTDGATTLPGTNPVTLDATGKGTFTINSLVTGTHTIVATYSGDTNYN